MILLAEYTNGNTHVRIYDDGTKVREYTGVPTPVHPESIDVKITDYCDMGCVYCHESSTTHGKHADLDILLNTLSHLPPGVEIALGGGNPLSHPGLVDLLQQVKTQGLIANLTVNQGHLHTHHDLLVDMLSDGLIHGLGVSITNKNYTGIGRLLHHTNNIVYHVIAGVNQVTVLDQLLMLPKTPCKVLVLGYKVFGLGVACYNQVTYENLKTWYLQIPKYLTKCQVSFDNLAIQQLRIERLLTKDAWSRLYMGDDFEYTMYIDAVDQMFAPSSTSQDRIPLDVGIIKYFTKS
jgi:hypothetical protein